MFNNVPISINRIWGPGKEMPADEMGAIMIGCVLALDQLGRLRHMVRAIKVVPRAPVSGTSAAPYIFEFRVSLGRTEEETKMEKILYADEDPKLPLQERTTRFLVKNVPITASVYRRKIKNDAEEWSEALS